MKQLNITIDASNIDSDQDDIIEFVENYLSTDKLDELIRTNCSTDVALDVLVTNLGDDYFDNIEIPDYKLAELIGKSDDIYKIASDLASINPAKAGELLAELLYWRNTANRI